MANEGQVLVRAIYSFKGKNNDELNFEKGDIITVTQIVEGGWWEGTLDEVTGWFPSNYVKECKPGDASASSKKRCSSGAKFPDYMSSRQESMHTYRNVVLKDIVESESSHIADLQNLILTYLRPLQCSEKLSASDYKAMVANLEDIADCHRKLLTLLEESLEMQPKLQRPGGIFMQLAPQLKALHMTYCANHPKAVTILEKYREELTIFMESHGAPSPGLMVLTTGLSKPFRRLEKYSGMLQELERHMEESHADRGDTQRAIHVYRDIAASCLAIRRQREMELEVLTGTIHGWEGEEISTLGEIITMTSVVVYVEATRERKDRYLVLFPQTLILLSVSHCMSSFMYEGKLPLSGINVNRIEEEAYQNAFEISGSLIESMIVVCPTKEDQEHWLDLLQHQSSNRSTILTKAAVIPKPAIAPSACSFIPDLKRQSTPVKEQFIPHNRVWSKSCLRPAPPMRPCLALGLKDDYTMLRNSGRLQRKKQERSHDDDAQILSVIEAYCTSAKTRYTVNSVLLDSPQMLIAEEEKIMEEPESGMGVEEKSLVDTVYALKDSVKELKQETRMLSKQLEEERCARKRLKEIICKHFLSGREDIIWDC